MALLQSQKDTFAVSLLSTWFWGGISVNPVERKFCTVALLQSQKDTCAVSLLCTWLWHFCRAIKILVQYLCISLLCPWFWGTPVNFEKVLHHCGSLLQSHKDTFAVSLLGTLSTLLKTSFVLWHFCRALKILVQHLYYAY